MPPWIRNSISMKIGLCLALALAIIMTGFTAVVTHQKRQALQKVYFDKARAMALFGAKTMERVLEDAIQNGVLSGDAVFDTQYRKITEGLLSKTKIPKYRTRYDSYLDQRLPEILDSLLSEDESVIFAALVDRNGYLPTHNSKYSLPLTGDAQKDLTGNRTKRIFDDPVGLNAARFTGNENQKVLRQVYKRDTGVTMWDVSTPVYVNGRHWGAFRIGLSMTQIESTVQMLLHTIGASFFLMLAIAVVTTFLVLRQMTRPLKNVTKAADLLSRGSQIHAIESGAQDEVGTLVSAFNRMAVKLNQTMVSRDYFNKILKSMHESLIILFPDGTIESLNESACTTLKASPEELIGTPINSVMPKGPKKGLTWGEFFIRCRSVHSQEAEFVTLDNEIVPISISCVRVFDEDGETACLVLVAQNISQRKKAEMELSKAYEELKASQSIIVQQEKLASIGQLAAGVAHEINTPIGFISSNLNSLGRYMERITSFIRLQDRTLNSTGEIELLEEVKKQRKKLKIDYLLEDSPDLLAESLEGTDHVSKIVQGLKNFSRNDGALSELTNLNKCLENAINIVWNEIKYNATLEKDLLELPPTLCYPRKLTQVFVNLLVNAAHAIEKDGKIMVKSWHEEGHIHIKVSDTGCGIPQENITKIFDPFFTTKEVGKGTGLGMSISYDIVKAHGGTISVQSQVGAGTTFLVRLPQKS